MTSRIVAKEMSYIKFEVISEVPVSRADLAIEQDRLGYCPDGYSMDIAKVSMSEGRYIYTWTCNGSCD